MSDFARQLDDDYIAQRIQDEQERRGNVAPKRWSGERMIEEARKMPGLQALDVGPAAPPTWQVAADLCLLTASWAWACAVAGQTPRRVAGIDGLDSREGMHLDKLIARRWFWSTHSAWREQVRSLPELKCFVDVHKRIQDSWAGWSDVPEAPVDIARIKPQGSFVCSPLSVQTINSLGATVLWDQGHAKLSRAAFAGAQASLTSYLRDEDGVHTDRRDTCKAIRYASDILRGCERINEQVTRFADLRA